MTSVLFTLWADNFGHRTGTPSPVARSESPAMVPALLLASLAAPQSVEELEFSSPGNLDLVIGVDTVRYSTRYWNAMPQPDQELQVKVGTRLVFKYDTSHDVSLADSEAGWLDCDTDGFEELAEPTYGGGAAGEPENLFAAVVTAVGE